MSHRSCSCVLTLAFIVLLVSPASAQFRGAFDVPQVQQAQEVVVPAPWPSLPPTTAIPNLNNGPTLIDPAPTPEMTAPPGTCDHSDTGS
jgi:hypothetical protein